MISQTIARRYAQALLSLGQEDGNFAKYGEELAAFAEVMAIPEVTGALTNPLYPKDARRQVLDQILSKLKPSQIVKNFIVLLQDKGRINHAEATTTYYKRLVDEVNGVKRASITTATPVDEKVKKQIKATMEKMTGSTIILEVLEDPELIGGVVAKVGDLTLDGSVRTQLKNLKESLIKG